MFKRLILLFVLLVYPIIVNANKSNSSDSFNEDYFVGLKAFEDGFYDVSRHSLLSFLSSNGNSKDAGYAIYILYQVYIAENDFKNAKETFDKLVNYNDKRFDTNKLEVDKMYITTKLSCEDAEKLLFTKKSNLWLNVYLNSSCGVNEHLIKYALNPEFSIDNLYLLIDKIKNNKDYMLLVYNNLQNNHKTKKILNYYGKYFASNNMINEFWKLYETYKDSDMVSIALNEIWNSKDYQKYINTFNNDIQKDFKLDNSVYCRMIESSNQLGLKFNCNIIDNCLDKKRQDFIQNKLACYMKNEDKSGISEVMKNVNIKDASNLCEYAKYLVGKNLYSSSFLEKFSLCKDKNVMYEALYNYKDYKGLISLIGKSNSQIDLAYLSIAYQLSGNVKKAKELIANITDLSLLEMIKNRTGLTK